MKKILLTVSFVFVMTLALSYQAYSQWNCVLATEDASANGPGDQVPSVALIDTSSFVALCLRVQIPAGQTDSTTDDAWKRDSVSSNYLVGYSHPTNFTGRMTVVPYTHAGLFTKWVSGFDEVQLYRAFKAVGTKDSLVYVANNDVNHNVLVFRLSKDSVISTDDRLVTDAAGTGGSGSDIMGLAVDNSGYVYVLNIYGSATNTTEVRIYKGIKASPTTWGQAPHTDTPVSTIDLPHGVYRGLAVSPDGKQLFISSVTDRNVVKYQGTPTGGYTKVTGFNFALTAADTIPLSVAPDTARPLGMAYLSPNNILFVACARWLGNNILTHGGTSGYQYSRIYAVNPNNGAILADSIDVANYYFIYTGAYSTQDFAQNISGYSSAYDVAFDANKDMYTQSFYSWTVERWHNSHTLQTITLGVRDVSNSVPEQYSLAQNYPNPFNPATTIQFSLKTGSHVELTVTNVLGQPVKTLVNEEVAAGTHEVTFDASAMASGIYFYTLRTGSFIETKKMILTK
jgi:Secretion system C-terminal sorting domain